MEDFFSVIDGEDTSWMCTSPTSSSSISLSKQTQDESKVDLHMKKTPRFALEGAIQVKIRELYSLFENPDKNHAFVLGGPKESNQTSLKRKRTDEDQAEHKLEILDDESPLQSKPVLRVIFDSRDSRLYSWFKDMPWASMKTIYPADVHYTIDDSVIRIKERKGSDYVSGILNGQFKQERYGQTTHPLPNCQQDIIWEADGTKLKSEDVDEKHKKKATKVEIGFGKHWKNGVSPNMVRNSIAKRKFMDGFCHDTTFSMQDSVLLILSELSVLVRFGSRFYSRVTQNQHSCATLPTDGGDFEKAMLVIMKGKYTSPADRLNSPYSILKFDLLAINKMSPPIAELLAKRYKCMATFISTLDGLGPMAAPKMLAELKYKPNKTGKERRLGPELAKRIYEMYFDAPIVLPPKKKRAPKKTASEKQAAKKSKPPKTKKRK